jgi:hypothetical protein
MEISNLIHAGASALFRHLRNSLKSLPTTPTTGKFENRTVPSDSISLADRVTAPLSSGEAIPPSLSTTQESSKPDVIFTHIFQPLAKLFKKSLSSGPFPAKNPSKITGRVVLLAGGGLLSVYVLFKFVIPYFFPRQDSGKKTDDSSNKRPRDPAHPPAKPAAKPAPVPAADPVLPSPSNALKPAVERASSPPRGEPPAPLVPPPAQPAVPSPAPDQPASSALPAPPPAAAEPASSAALTDGSALPAAASSTAEPPRDAAGAEMQGAQQLPPAAEETEAIEPHKPAAASSVQRHSPPRSSASSPAPKTLLKRMAGIVFRTVFPTRHFSKWAKYRIIQELMKHFSINKSLLPCDVASQDPDIAKIAKSWNTLVEALIRPDKKKIADGQYCSSIEALREIASLFLSAKDTTKAQLGSLFKFIKQLSYFRFAGIGLYNYCQGLVELVTGLQLPKQLTLANFVQELKIRTEILNDPADDHSMSPAARELKKLSGTANIGFDPLSWENVPYLDGELGFNGRSIRILRHGDPFCHNDPWGLVGGFCGKIPVLNWYVNRQTMSREPVLNADYVAMILEAEERGENILQAILEEGEEKLWGDESARVRERLKLVLFHKNFFALAVRFDGTLFKRQYELPPDKKESIAILKSRLALQLIPSQEPVLSDDQHDKILEKMLKQLEETGFCIPEKVMKDSDLRSHIEPLLQEVQELYFPNVKDIENLMQHQAFIILSYVHIVLFLCVRLKISILEAFCKDDIDRGNVFKTILKLHFLYLTGQITSETLRYVLVNTLAAPFIVKKQAIIDSRLVLIERVVPFIKDAFERNPHPKTTIFGDSIINPYYRVFETPGQTIYPDNASSKNIEEYLAFLDEAQETELKFEGNLIHDTANVVDEDQIRNQISQTAKTLNLRVDGELLKPKAGASPQEIDNLFTNSALERIRAILQMRAELSESQAWKIASCIHLGLQTRLLEALKKTFDNPQLQVSIELDMDAMNKKPESGFNLTVANKIAKLEFVLFYKIVCKDAELAAGYTLPAIKALITIPDLSTGLAQFDWSLVK